MKLTRALALLCAAINLAGCVTEKIVYDKAGVTPAAFEQDKNQCVYEAKLGTPNSKMMGTRGVNAVLSANVDEVGRIKELQSLCMQAHGYQKRTVTASNDEADMWELIPEIKQGK